jgi:ribonuclease P protein component
VPTPVGRFPPSQRIRKRAEYQEIQSRGRRVSTLRFVFLIYARPDNAGARLGITVSRRVGSAPVRNRAKRLIREAFRSSRELWPDDIDVVVIARRPPETAKLADVVAEWQSAERSLRTQFDEARRGLERRRKEAETTGRA